MLSVIRRSITVQPSSSVVLRQPKYNEKITYKISKQLRTIFLSKSSMQSYSVAVVFSDKSESVRRQLGRHTSRVLGMKNPNTKYRKYNAGLAVSGGRIQPMRERQ